MNIELKTLIENLINQLEITDYTDELGHSVESNKAYIELKEYYNKHRSLRSITATVEPTMELNVEVKINTDDKVGYKNKHIEEHMTAISKTMRMYEKQMDNIAGISNPIKQEERTVSVTIYSIVGDISRDLAIEGNVDDVIKILKEIEI